MSFDILLITRFSLNLKMNTNKKQLHDIDRLKLRLYLFKNITLKSILSQTYKNFKWIILYDKFLPNSIYDILYSIVKDYDFIILEEYKQWGLKNLKPLLKFTNNNNNHVLTLRIDDDDAISKKFIERYVNIINDNKNSDFLILTPRNGIIWSYSIKFDEGNFKKKQLSFIAIGLGLYVNKKKIPLTIHFHDHSKLNNSILNKLNKNNGVYISLKKLGMNDIEIRNILRKKIHHVINNEYTYIRTISSVNDSSAYVKRSNHFSTLTDKNILNYLYYFNLDLACFNNLNKIINNYINDPKSINNYACI